MAKLVGILNLTRDSFSDGGRYVDPDAAVERAHALVADGADWIDVGAESTHPDSEDVSAAEELRRLEPVVGRLADAGLAVAVDTWKPEVMRRVLELGARAVNDVRALQTPGAVEAVRDSDAELVLMHSVAASARAERLGRDASPSDIVARVVGFFEERIEALRAAGVDPQRLVLDPGMGFFLSPDPAVSLAVLRGLPQLRALGRPVYVCTSRKSFLGQLLGREVAERGPATLASELYACRAGVDYIRTHDVRALADAIAVQRAIES
ncbi:MAG: dihydropteroate synthase [Planctomycetota bacterium]